MAIQQPWTIYEAAILLEGYLQFSSGKVTRKQAISDVSDKLRQMALNRGEVIDDIYRNINGITFQMASLESAYRGYTVLKPPTRLFMEIVSIHHADPERYKKILGEAMAMCKGQKNINIEQYANWLSSRVKSDFLVDIYLAYELIERYARKYKLLDTALLETTDLSIIQKIQNAIVQKKEFRAMSSNRRYICGLAMRHYVQYLEEIGPSEKICIEQSEKQPLIPVSETTIPVSSDTMVDPSPTKEEIDTADGYWGDSKESKAESIEGHIREVLKAECELNPYGTTITYMQTKLGPIEHVLVKSILTNAAWAKFQFGKWHYVEAKEEPEKELNIEIKKDDIDSYVVSFEKLPDLSYTTPLCVSYFGETKAGFPSWSNLYLTLVAWLYEDYDHIIKPGMSFTTNGAGRIDLGSRQMVFQMRNPKKLPTESAELFLECNISATYIGAKIKHLLDICNVDYENIVIEYRKENRSKRDEHVLPLPSRETVEVTFGKWLREVAKMSEASCRGYVSALRTAEHFTKDHYYYTNTDLLSTNRDVAKATADELLADPVFGVLNAEQHNRFSAAIRKLLEFHGFSAASPNARQIDKKPDESLPIELNVNKELFITVLKQKFARGFRLGSSLDMKKYKRCYESIHDESIELEDEEIEQIIRTCGIVHAGKIYLPEIMIPPDTKEKLVRYILDSFAEGKTTIYYEALFKLFSDDFLEYYIYDADMLKAYLAHINEGKFHIAKSYLSKDVCSVSDPYDEVKAYLKTRVAPLDSDELCQILSHIPAAKVKQILGSYDEFVNNGKSAYFHVSIVHFYDEDFDHIREIISTSIKDNGFVSGNELFKAVQSLRPHILENNPAISALGLRDTLKYHLGKEYSFNGNVISDVKQNLMMADVFAEFAKKRACFTIAELSTLASELETGIYFESIFEYVFRVSHDDFVSKHDAHFSIEQTDKILDRFCTGKYISIKSISDFGIFPDAGYQWNSFLLEQYVHSFSKNYRLIHVGFNQHACVGAIVKRSAGITNIDDFIVESLANSGIELTKPSALAYLVQQGYLARKNFSGIEHLLIQANAQRNIKEKK